MQERDHGNLYFISLFVDYLFFTFKGWDEQIHRFGSSWPPKIKCQKKPAACEPDTDDEDAKDDMKAKAMKAGPPTKKWTQWKAKTHSLQPKHHALPEYAWATRVAKHDGVIPWNFCQQSAGRKEPTENPTGPSLTKLMIVVSRSWPKTNAFTSTRLTPGKFKTHQRCQRTRRRLQQSLGSLEEKNNMVMKKKLEGGFKSNMTGLSVEWFVWEFGSGQPDGVGNRKHLRPMFHMLINSNVFITWATGRSIVLFVQVPQIDAA